MGMRLRQSAEKVNRCFVKKFGVCGQRKIGRSFERAEEPPKSLLKASDY